MRTPVDNPLLLDGPLPFSCSASSLPPPEARPPPPRSSGRFLLSQIETLLAFLQHSRPSSPTFFFPDPPKVFGEDLSFDILLSLDCRPFLLLDRELSPSFFQGGDRDHPINELFRGFFPSPGYVLLA